MTQADNSEQRAREVLAAVLKPSNSYDADVDGQRVLSPSNDVACFLCPRDILRAMLAFQSQPAEPTCKESGEVHADGKVEREGGDYRGNLARALFEASYGNTLIFWSDETRDFWLNRADAALAPQAAPVGEGKYLVWSNEHRAWWKPERCGYTRYVERAGRYAREEAYSIASTRGGGWPKEGNPDEIAIPEADAVAQYHFRPEPETHG